MHINMGNRVALALLHRCIVLMSNRIIKTKCDILSCDKVQFLTIKIKNLTCYEAENFYLVHACISISHIKISSKQIVLRMYYQS
jgi:hypothetical protein